MRFLALGFMGNSFQTCSVPVVKLKVFFPSDIHPCVEGPLKTIGVGCGDDDRVGG